MKALTATDADADASPAISVRSSSLLNAALCHLKLEDWERADTACTGAIALDPTSAKALYRRGTARLRLSRAPEAVEDLSAASKRTPSDKDIKRMLAGAEAADAAVVATGAAEEPSASSSTTNAVPSSSTAAAATALSSATGCKQTKLLLSGCEH